MLQEAKGEISSDYLEKLTARMPQVSRAVITAKGGFFFFTLQVHISIKIITSNSDNVSISRSFVIFPIQTDFTCVWMENKNISM